MKDDPESQVGGRVIVVIPAHNRLAMLRRAVESVLAQTYRELDLVVVDDASSEDLSEVQDMVEGAGHRWLRLGENVGPAAARNAGVNAGVNGWQYLAFLDSDDVWAAEKLRRQVNWHADHAGIEISQCEEQWVRNGQLFKKKNSQQQPEGWFFEDCVKVCCISPSCVMMSRRLWQDLGGFDQRYRVCEDYELWLRVALNESVGLVKGASGALVTRHGGHGDQLSFAVPAMDRFRVLALLELVNAGQLSQEQKQVLEQGILRRAAVLGKGAKKRGKLANVTTYQRALKREWIEMAGEMEVICFGSRVENG